jgi:hypothetical protein
MTNRTDIVWIPFGIDDTLYTLEIPIVSSGATATIPSGQRYALWYDTTNNIVKFTDDSGATWVGGQSLPIGIVSSDNTKIVSIDQVFNGMGYIGSTVWVDKGVKGLIPNGRNEDGTLRNIEWVNNKILTHTITDIALDALILAPFGNHYNSEQLTSSQDKLYFVQPTQPSKFIGWWYNTMENICYGTDGSKWFKTDKPFIKIAKFGNDNLTITNFQSRQTVNLATKDMVDGQWVQAYLSLGSTTAIGEYTLDLSDHLPNDGYQYEVMFAGQASNTTTEIPSLQIKTDLTGYSTVCVIKGAGSGTYSDAWNIILPVGTGRTVSFKILGKEFTSCTKYVHSYRRIGTNI